MLSAPVRPRGARRRRAGPDPAAAWRRACGDLTLHTTPVARREPAWPPRLRALGARPLSADVTGLSGPKGGGTDCSGAVARKAHRFGGIGQATAPRMSSSESSVVGELSH